jgi:tetratricopeptide (TPR) repeat protein
MLNSAQNQLEEATLPDPAHMLNNPGALDSAENRSEEARQEYEEALQIRRELAQKNPQAYLPDLAETLNNLGVLQYQRKRFEEARQEYEEALQIRRELAVKNPQAYLPGLAQTQSLHKLGLLDSTQGIT